MEKYKFKAKRLEENEWVCGYYFYDLTQKKHKLITYKENHLLGLVHYIYGDKKIKTRVTQCTYIINPKTLVQLKKCSKCNQWFDPKNIIKTMCNSCAIKYQKIPTT